MRSRGRQPLTVIGQHEITLENRRISYTLKKSRLIRGVRLEIHNDSGLTVVVPGRCSHRQIQDVLQQKSRWILRHMPPGRPMQMPLFKKEVDHGEIIAFMGRSLRLQLEDSLEEPVLKHNVLHIPRSDRSGRARMMERWYRGQAAIIFKQKADAFARTMGVSYRTITIRGQKKRWASASPLGTLSLNWKLLVAPEHIIDYVIMHELAHFRHMDHSQDFWEFLARFSPGWRRHRRWLLDHEDELKLQASFRR